MCLLNESNCLDQIILGAKRVLDIQEINFISCEVY